MRAKRRFALALWLAALLAPSAALADGIDGWIAERLAEEILAGVPSTTERPRIAVRPFAADELPVSISAADALNASLLSALIARSGGRHVFVARGALKSLVRDVSDLARPGPRDPVETLLENARADILVIGSLRRARGDVILSYKAVTVADGAVLASTKPYRLRLRDADLPQATLGLDQALPVAARYLMQRVDGLEVIRIGDIRYHGDTAEPPFASYLRDRVADEFRRQSTGVLTGAGVRVETQDKDTAPAFGAYRLIGTYWPLGDAVELSLSLRGADGVVVTWREKVRRNSIPATLALGPAGETGRAPDVLPWRRVETERSAPTFTTPARGLPTVAEAQRLLLALGYEPGPVNGVLGLRTRRAITAFQRNNGLGPDGRMTRALVASLREQRR